MIQYLTVKTDGMQIVKRPYPTNGKRTMRYNQLSDSDIEVSALTLGMWNFSGDETWGDQDEDDAIETIQTAIDLGVTTFDNAEAYGDGYAERLLGRAIQEYNRDDLVICSKVSAENFASDDLKAACEASLDRMDTDYIDVYYLHWPSRNVPIAESLRSLEDLKSSGKIREIAVSNFGPRDLEDLFDTLEKEDIDVEPVVNQLPYSLLWRAIEYDIIPMCDEYNVSIASYSSLAQGLLADKFAGPDDVPEGRARTRHFSSERPLTRHSGEGAETLSFETIDRIREICQQEGVEMVEAAILWNLTRPQIDTVVAGARSPEQIEANVNAVDLGLTDENLSNLTDATEELREELGSNPDLWQTDSRYR